MWPLPALEDPMGFDTWSRSSLVRRFESESELLSSLAPSCKLCVTWRGFSLGASLATYFDGKNPILPKHLPRHQSGSLASITVTLYPALAQHEIKSPFEFMNRVDKSQRWITWDPVHQLLVPWSCREPRRDWWVVISAPSVDQMKMSFILANDGGQRELYRWRAGRSAGGALRFLVLVGQLDRVHANVPGAQQQSSIMMNGTRRSCQRQKKNVSKRSALAFGWPFSK